MTLTGHALARRAAECALTKKARRVLILNVKPLTTLADYFVICHGDSENQVRAITDAVEDGLRGEGARPWHREGYSHLHWVLLDYIDVVVHVFYRDTRDFYRLERLWMDAETETLGEPDE
jgi:ribosome-associated protein